MKKIAYIFILVFLILVTAFAADDFSLSVFGPGKFTNVDNVGNIGLYSNTPSYEFSASSTVYIAVSQVNDQKINSVTFSLYLNYSTSPITGYSNIPINDDGIAPDVLANDGVFIYSVDLSTISGLKHNDFITAQVKSIFADGNVVTRQIRFLIDETMNFNTYKMGNVRSAIFNSGEELKINFINYTPISINSNDVDSVNNLKITQLDDSSNSIELHNMKRNTFFVNISDPSNPSDVANPDKPIFAAPHFSLANIKTIKYAYSGAWTQDITSGNNTYVRKDYIKYLSFKADEPSNWWKITALGECPSPTSPPATMTFRLVDSNGTTIASYTGKAKSENVLLNGSGVTANISIDDPSKLPTDTEATMFYAEEFSENFILDFKPHVYGVSVSQNPTYDKNNIKIDFYNDFTGSVNFIVYNDTGEIVYTDSKNVTISGSSRAKNSFIWNFRDKSGKRVPSGKKYYFKIIPFVVDTSSNETVYGSFVYGSILLKLPIGKITGINPNILKTGEKLNYSYNLSESATVSVILTRDKKTYYISKNNITEPGDYVESFTIPSSAVDGIYTLKFNAKTINMETDESTTITIDNTPPIISFSLTQKGTSIELSGTTDSNPKGISIVYDLYQSKPNSLVLKSTFDEIITNGKLDKMFTGLVNGYYIVEITAKDPVGNSAHLKKGIGIGGDGEVLTDGSTITTYDGEVKIVIPKSSANSNYIVSITEESTNNSKVYKFSPSISLSKYATVTLTLSSTPSDKNLFLISTFNDKINLMLKLSTRISITKIKDIQKITIKTVDNPKILQISYDKIVREGPMRIFINNYETTKVSIFILDLKGNLVKIVTENETLQPGNNEKVWDLTGRFGEMVPNGQYILYVVSDKGKVAKLFGVKR